MVPILLIYLPFYTDTDLLSLMKATHTINNWFLLGLELGVSSSVLGRIEQDSSKVLDRLCNMLLHWIGTGRASWAVLVRALHSPLLNKEGLANEIARNQPCKCNSLSVN